MDIDKTEEPKLLICDPDVVYSSDFWMARKVNYDKHLERMKIDRLVKIYIQIEFDRFKNMLKFLSPDNHKTKE